MRLLSPIMMCTLATAAWPALAVKVVNRDTNSHDLTIKCSSTTQGFVGASSTRDKGPCTVTVKKFGSQASGSGNDQLVIRSGRIGKD
ncbi:MAG: hypothetical protein JNN18_00470 [Rubrivivax sp.]|nr:hypothetical protein [Rubrivivax sp.]